MIQEIITYIILTATLSYTAFALYKTIEKLFSKKKAKSFCSGDCAACRINPPYLPKNL